MGKLELSHVKMMSSISLIKLVRNKSLVDIIVEVRHFDAVAPARERGLKLLLVTVRKLSALRRSRKGAWIEIVTRSAFRSRISSRSRKGAWIEIYRLPILENVFLCRSRKGAWIEIDLQGRCISI